MKITFEQIGIIHTPFTTKENMPIQPKGAIGIKGKIILNKEYIKGLKDLNGYSHIILLYYFHKSKSYELQTKPFLDDTKRGVFSTRAPKRPNGIGMSVVRLLNIDNNILYIENVDMLDGTPLLDIKPYVSYFDDHKGITNGWIENKTDDISLVKSDERFK